MNSESGKKMNGGTQDVGRLMNEAVAHQQAGRIQQAEWLYQAVLRLQPGHADANHNLGVAAMQTNRPAEALSFLKAALEVKPEIGQYWLSYVAALTQAGHEEAARQVLAQAIQRGLGGAEVDKLADQLDVRLATEPAAAEIEHAMALFEQKRFAELVGIAQTLTRRFPEHGFGWQLLGAVLKEQGRYQESLVPMQEATRLLPDDAEAQVELGLVFERLGRLPEAEACQRAAVELRADSAPAHFNLGNVLLAQGHVAEAEASYRHALQVGGDFAEGHNNLGACLKLQGDLALAEASFRRALELRPDYAEALRNLGDLLAERGET